MAEIKNAIIRSAEIFVEDHGLLTAYLSLDYGGSCQGFGGYSFEKHPAPHFAASFIRGCLRVAGVEKWSQLIGRTIRADADYTKIHRIGHIVDDVWYNPESGQ